MDLGLDGTRVLVTGSSRGIGYAIASGFLSEGARVALVAKEVQALETATNRLRSQYGDDAVVMYPMDCLDSRQWSETIETIKLDWGGLDVVISNIGNGTGSDCAVPDNAEFLESWRTNLQTAIETSRATINLLQPKGGSILFISSIAGLEAIGAPTGYSVAKSGLFALAKQMSKRLAPLIRVNCISPGNIFFEGGVWERNTSRNPREVELMIKEKVPLRRFGTPDEIADAAVFLSSTRASFITGENLVVDGGQTVRF